MSASVSTGIATQREGASEQLSKPIVLAVLLLLVAALVFLFWPDLSARLPQSQNQGQNSTGNTVAQLPVAVAPPVAGGETVIGAPRETTLTAGDKGTAAISPTGALTSNSLTYSLTVQNSMVATASSTVSLNIASFDYLATGQDTVQFKAIKDVWVDVLDGSGKILLRRTLTKGEVAGAGGAPPLKVTIGRADSVQVQLRGKAFDLAPHVRENIARFEVK